MLDSGKIKEIQVKLHLSSRSEMHKVIESARQTVPLMLASTTPAVSTTPALTPLIQKSAPPSAISPFQTIGNNLLSNFGIPGLGNPAEIPQPAVIAPPAPFISPTDILKEDDEKKDDEVEKKRKERRRTRSRSRSRDKERKDRKRDRRDRSRSKERRRRDRSRSRERRGKRERHVRSRSRERSPSLRSRNRRGGKSPSISNSQEKDSPNREMGKPFMNPFAVPPNLNMPLSQMLSPNVMQNGPAVPPNPPMNRFNDPSMFDTMNKMQELAKKRNPNAFQNRMDNEREQNGAKSIGRGGVNRGAGNFRGRDAREGRASRFDDQQNDCCVAIRNAPNHTSYGDVRRFFPFLIDKHGIKMINDNMGRRTGNIFVRFCEIRSKQLALHRKNNELKGAHVIVEDLDDESYDAAVDSFLPFRDDNEEERNMVVNIEEQELSKTTFTVLKLKDLPNYIKEHDIIKTFGDFSLMSIALSDDKMTRTRIAYVQFAKHEDAREAFERRERIAFGRRQTIVTTVSDEEYNEMKNSPFDKAEPGEMDQERQERQEERGPPVREQENKGPRDPRQRRQFDNGPQHIQGQSQGSPFFVSQFGPQSAFPGGSFPGGPQFPSGFPAPGGVDPRTAATNWANRPPFPSQVDNMGGNNQRDNAVIAIEDEPLDCVLMKGLPHDATDRTIVNFLSDTGAVPARIHLMLDTNGMPSGDCFCEFRSTQEARMAVVKHGKNLEGCRVTVDLVPRGVVEEALDGPKQMDAEEPNIPPQGNVPPPYFDQMRGGGFNGRGTFRGRGGFNDRGGYNRGFDRGGYRGWGGYDRGGPRGGFDFRGRGRGRGRGGGGYENGGIRDEPDPELDDFGVPGCVVSMENVPFRATIEELLLFFSEFELTQEDVIRRYNDRGQPTGDARVAFRTPFDAQRAVKTRHMDTIHDRRISLNII